MKLENTRNNIRIKRIEFKNFRNIESGAVDFPNADAKNYYEGNPSILGLYGQNGSGKSSVIMALGILKEVLSGEKIDIKYASSIRAGCDSCTLSFKFSVFTELFDDDGNKIENEYVNNCLEYSYDFDIKRRVNFISNDLDADKESTTLFIDNEVLKIKRMDPNGNVRSSKRTWFDTRKTASDDYGISFGNKVNFKILTRGDKENADKYKEIKTISKENGTSFLFSNRLCHFWIELIDIVNVEFNSDLSKNIEYSLNNYNEITKNKLQYNTKDEKSSIEKAFLNASDEETLMSTAIITVISPILYLKNYGYYFLQVVDTITTGITNINTHLPLLLWKRKRHENYSVFVYKCVLSMDDPTVVPEEYYKDSRKALSAVSDVLNRIVPDMALDIADLGKRLTNNNKELHCFEILSKRNNQTIPLKYESDGIRRMVSILSLLIAVYNEKSFTIAIDEIDSGIFEYMLGEILSVMSDSIKGQFVFTSHNLRPLEVLPTKYLCFTTTNPKSRFTTLSRRGNSNMRDTYFRNIVLGSNNGKDPIYNSTDKFEIERAFYKAGHPEDDEL